MKIQDLFKAFRQAYNNIYADKIEAKKTIQHLKQTSDVWKTRFNDMIDIEYLLIRNKDVFPQLQWQQFIQKTYDLIYYGFDVSYKEDENDHHILETTYYGSYGGKYGLADIYGTIYDIYDDCISLCEDRYKQGEYENIQKLVDECEKSCEEICERYQIRNINLKENEKDSSL